ncbi:unnamed protein product [Prunus armeniaca]|uniref:Uncharacterized protein n=1 Tax=Prunus armeniaca TaxID=36596 RepID=A0A6J5WSZ3_PRUAR|nr:unnamed protein product [Prunus armeniaca]
MAYIGEKGINLSVDRELELLWQGYIFSLYPPWLAMNGPQFFLLFFFLNLIKAMYNGSDMFILDDVLSAVDAQVARCILYNAILGPLMKQQTRAISSADTIVVMDKGHVKWGRKIG